MTVDLQKFCNRIIALFCALVFLFGSSVQAQSVLNPNDPVINYDAANLPTKPAYNTVGKWVRTPRLAWNTDSYKCYYLNGSVFRLKFPKNFQYGVNDGKKYPMIVMFHGIGEKGTIYDNEYQLYNGGEAHRNAVDNGLFDGFVLFMQSQSGYWGSAQYDIMDRFIDYMVATSKLDVDRVSVHGLSAGGSGCWSYLIEHGKYVAAALPMSAQNINNVTSDKIDGYKYTPVWTFQGGLDQNPLPSVANSCVNAIRAKGGNITYSLYPETAHGTWYNAYVEPDFFPFMMRAHKANPYALFGKTTYCQEDAINTTLGLMPGFDGYEWRKDDQLISGATGNSIVVTETGSYTARFKRGSNWSDWSPTPVVISRLASPSAVAITVSGNQSKVLPSPDGKTSLSMSVPSAGGNAYRWYFNDGSTAIDTSKNLTVSAAGSYTARVSNEAGCLSVASAPVVIVNADGPNKPDAATSLQAVAASSISINLSWQQAAVPVNNETGFEVYRSTTAGSGYQYVGVTGADQTSFTDNNLVPNTSYYYVVRAINATGASAVSNQASATTTVDNTPPTAPGALRSSGSTQSSISLLWDPSTDASGILRYDIYMGNAKIGSTTTNSYTATGLTANQPYNFYVIAYDLAGNPSIRSSQLTAYAYTTGLSYKYYQGSYDALPNFTALTPVAAGNVNNVTLAPRQQDDYFAFLWEGYIKIPVSGSYTFRTNSDDGSRLYLSAYSSSATPLADNDGLHGTQYREGTVSLTAGVYPISITFFEKTGGEVMEVSWKTPQTNGNYVSIPDSAFTSYLPPVGGVPGLPANLAAVAASYNTINLSWTDNSADETGFEIYRSTSANSGYQIAGTVGANVVSFADSSLTASTTYYFKIKALGSNGASDFSAVASATTANPPAVPNSPTALTVNGVSPHVAVLSWTGTAANGITYQLQRSADGIAFSDLASIAGSAATSSYGYTDSSLNGHTTYYYRVRAANVGGNSAFSDVATVTTANSRPVLQSVADIVLRSSDTKTISVQATDGDGDALVFTGIGLPDFATLSGSGSNAATLSLAPNAGSLGVYPVKVIATDPQGGADTISFQIRVDDNHLPVISQPAPATVSVDEGSSHSFTLVATDEDAGSTITWNTAKLPSFATVSEPVAGSLQVTLNPYYNHAGTYPVTIYVNDGQGGTDSSVFIVTVNDVDPGYHIYLNFNANTGNAQAGVWNNTNRAPVAGDLFSSLKDDKGNITSVGLTVNSGAWAATTTGKSTGNNSGVYVDKVISTVWSMNPTATQTMELNGLSQGFVYNLVFFASKNDATNTFRGVRYTVNGVSTDLNPTNNTNNTATLYGLTPDANGKLVISIDRVNPINNPNPGIYIGAMEIIAQLPDNGAPTKPGHLAAASEPQAVVLSWTDLAYNESRYDVYRSQDNAAGPFSLLKTLPANASGYADSTVAGNHSYAYYVVAVNTIGGTNSDTATVSVANMPPVISTIANIMMRAGDTKTISFTATDSPGETLTFTALNLPAFGSFTDNGNGSGTIVLSPASDQTGDYALKVIVTDQFGGGDTTAFTLQVTSASSRSIWINLNNAPATNEGLPYNNLAATTSNGKTIALNDNVGTPTGASMVLVNSWTANFTNGGTTENNSGMFTDLVMSTGITVTDANPRTIRFTNLPAGKKFTFYFFGSRLAQYGVRNTNYTINGNTVTLNGANNTGNYVQLNELVPDANNTLELTVSRAADNTSAIFLNAIRIDVLEGTDKPAAPTSLTATGQSRQKIGLTWVDNAGSETGYLVLRSATAGGTFNPVATLPANTTQYVDQALAANTSYYYKVTALGSTTNSDTTAAVAGTTLKYTAYINFSISTDAQAPAPWNNMARDPLTTSAPLALNDDEGNSLGATLTITQNFTAGNDLGYTTGDNSGIYPDVVTKTVYWVDAGRTGSFKISGLDPAQKYNFSFFASRKSASATDSRTTLYTVNGTYSATLQVVDNYNRTVVISNILPSAAGEVTIDVTMPAGQSYGYIGALAVEAQGDAPNSGLRRSSTESEPALAMATAETIDPGAAAISAYPNPFTTGQLVVSLKNNRALDNATLDIYGSNGRLAHRQSLGNLPKGPHQIKVNIASQSIGKGLYFIQVTDTKGFRKAVKVVKQ
ncbi:MAG: PA14 domain-containing protein [Flavihumibacter sp.]